MKTQPIRRNKNIVSLSHDHHAGLLFCWKLRQGLKRRTEPGRILAYIHYFWQHHLLPHFSEEEAFLFILPDDPGIARAKDEHQRIGVLVDSILTGPSEGILRLLPVLADAVDNHIRFEERDLFPYLEKQLSEAQLESIGRHINENPHLPDNWRDEYWKVTTHSDTLK